MSNEIPAPLPLWDCNIDLRNDAAQGVVINELTVGEKFLLKCKGEPQGFAQEKLTLENTSKDNYLLKLLKVQSFSEGEAELLVTSYRAGKHQTDKMVLTDGTQKVQISPLQWEVKTVIQVKPGEKPEPYGPFGPFLLQIPMWYWIALGGLCLVVIIFASLWGRKKWQRKKMLRELEEHTTAMSPYHQLNKDLRQLDRQSFLKGREESKTEYVQELEQSFQMFLVRELRVPAHKWGIRAVMGEIRTKHRRLYQNCGKELREVLQELEKSRSAAKKVSVEDCEQLAALTRQISEKVWKYQGGEK